MKMHMLNLFSYPCWWQCFVTQFCHVASKVTINHKRFKPNLVTKQIEKLKNLRILFHVGEPLEPIP